MRDCVYIWRHARLQSSDLKAFAALKCGSGERANGSWAGCYGLWKRRCDWKPDGGNKETAKAEKIKMVQYAKGWTGVT